MSRFLSRLDVPLFFWIGCFVGAALAIVAQVLTLAIIATLNG